VFLSFLHLKPNFRYSSLNFARYNMNWCRISDKLANNKQTFTQVGFQLKFAFRIWPISQDHALVLVIKVNVKIVEETKRCKNQLIMTSKIIGRWKLPNCCTEKIKLD